ncbi:hypothetical protein JNB71_16870 [Rhizobium herbae]|uniref:Uncharacterized protein n=1 Tax=Rhizobium herbae TaxID=508661 RepID=A0ABS7HCM0_9HYPH|nr:hypothetical protein [Rhizobium herbae]MBW9064976.1 hypothetical protein [Rhizobium herbae]
MALLMFLSVTWRRNDARPFAFDESAYGKSLMLLVLVPRIAHDPAKEKSMKNLLVATAIIANVGIIHLRTDDQTSR